MASKFKIEKPGLAILSVFYVIAGGADLFVLFLSGFRLVPLGFLGVLSLITAYGLIRMRGWSVWLVAILLPLGVTFGATTLYASIVMQTFNPSLEVLSLHLMLIAYLVASVVASICVLAGFVQMGSE